MRTTPYPISYSSLNSFENCSLAHYHIKVAKDVGDTPHMARTWGDDVHQALETGVVTGTPLPEPMRPFQLVADKVRSVPDSTVHTEKEFCINASFQPTGWWDDDGWARCKVDVAIERGSKIVAIDYKTGKRKPSDQLKLTAAIIMHCMPHIQEVITGFVWLKTGEIDSEKFTRADLPRIWTDFLPRIKRFEIAFREGKWTPKPSGLCGWCPVTRQHCPYSKKGLAA